MLTLDLERAVSLRSSLRPIPYLMAQGMSLSRARTLMRSGSRLLLRDDSVRELCEALHCLPNDLFTWTGAADHPLAVLAASPAHDALKSLSAARHRELEQQWAQLAQHAPAADAPPPVMGGRSWLNVRRAMRLRTSGSTARALQQMGFTRSVASALTSQHRTTGRMRIGMEQLTRLCTALQCLPNDLYDFSGPQGHVLDALRKPTVGRLTQLTARLTPAQMVQLLAGRPSS